MEFTRRNNERKSSKNYFIKETNSNEKIDERLNIFFIDAICSFVIYNKIKINVKGVSLFTPTRGSFITDKYIIKYSNDILNIYSMNDDRSLIDSFIFTKFTNKKNVYSTGKVINTMNGNNTIMNENITNDNVVLFKKFILKRNYHILLYKDSSQIQFSKKEDYFIITEEMKKDGSIDKVKMFVFQVLPVGDDILYKAVSNVDTINEKIDILCVNSGYGINKKNSKWNGIPIGIII